MIRNIAKISDELLVYADELLDGTGATIEDVLALPLQAKSRVRAADVQAAEEGLEPLPALRAGWSAAERIPTPPSNTDQETGPNS